MAATAALTTIVSKTGQVDLPSDVRLRHRWDAGTRLIVEDTAAGVLLREAPLFPPTTIDDVIGCLQYDGPPHTIEEMDEGVMAEARRRARD